jgi:hypothetical protein
MLEIIRKYKDKSRLFIKEKFTEDGAGWLFLQQLIIAPMSLLTTVLLARILSISDYGYYKYVLSIYSIAAIFGLTGFYNIASLNIQRGQDEFFHLGFKYRKLLRWIPAKKEEMKKTVKAMGSGEDTGGLAFLPADTIDYKATDQTSVEMDWLNSLQYMEEIISYAMGVPVQLISSRSSTYNNMAEAKKKIYIDTIIPLVQDYCEDLTAFFQDDLQENERIWYDVSEIEELKEDVMTVAKGVREALKGVATVNEIRDTLTKKTGIELKSINKELGDKVLVTSSDMFLDDLNVELIDIPEENEEESTKE